MEYSTDKQTEQRPTQKAQPKINTAEHRPLISANSHQQSNEINGFGGDHPIDPILPDVGLAQSREMSSKSHQLPYLEQIQAAFGDHDVSGIEVHHADSIASGDAFTQGESIVFTGQPSIEVAAHEAAHVIQQRAGVRLPGGVGAAGDRYEKHADAVSAAVVSGQSAVPLLDSFQGQPGASSALQFHGQSEVEADQPWRELRSSLAPEALGEVDESIPDLIQANVALGLPDHLIDLIRGWLGLPRGGINRAFVEALREQQAPVEEAPVGPAQSDAVEEAPVNPVRPGVLDQAMVQRLDPGFRRISGSVLREARAFYRDRAGFWAQMSETEFNASMPDVARALSTSVEGLSQRIRRGVVVQVRVQNSFVAAVYDWQVFRQHDQAANGQLDEEGLAMLGPQQAAVNDSDLLATSESAVEGEEGPEPAVVEPTPAPEPEAVEVDPHQRVQPIIQRIRHALIQRQRAREGGRAAIAQADADLRSVLESAITSLSESPIQDLNPSNLARRQRTVPNWGRWCMRVLTAWSNGEPIPQRPGTSARAARRREARPLTDEDRALLEAHPNRTSSGDARQTLLESGMAEEDDFEDLSYTTWNSRLGTDADRDARVRHTVSEVGQMITRLQRIQSQINSAMAAEDLSRLRAALIALSSAEFESVDQVRRGRSWQPRLGRRPRRVAIERWTEPTLLRQGQGWVTRLGRAIQDGQRTAIANEEYARPVRMVTHGAVHVDLARTGVDVLNNHGRRIPPSRLHLDPIFAVAMVRFLEDIRGLGVTRLYTAGFLRAPLSPQDTHPRGQACDITGFGVGTTEIRLRGGYPMDTSNERYDHPIRGHSDWFDDTHQLAGRSHREAMLGIAARMPNFFTQIIGPGHNAAHMNHFHVQLTGNADPMEAMRAIAAYSDQPGWVRNRAEHQAPGWSEGDPVMDRYRSSDESGR